MKRRQITFYFSGDPYTICDYMLRLAKEFSKQDAVFGFLLFGKPYSLWRYIVHSKERIWEKKDGIFMIRQVYVLPFQRISIIRTLNKYIHALICYPFIVGWIKFRRGVRTTGKSVFIFYHPEKEEKYFRFIFQLFSRTHTTLFDVVDYPPVHRVKNSLQIYKKFIRKSDIVTVNSRTLYDIFSTIRKDIHVVPPGFAIEDFRHPKKTTVFPKDKPIVGYIGALGSRLDYTLLFRIISEHPQWRFVFWGPTQIVEGEREQEIKKNIDTLLSYKNVIHGFSGSKSEIAWIVSQFNICIIPYDVKQDQNKFCYPMKLLEYQYFDKPIISVPIVELFHAGNGVQIARNNIEWEKYIKKMNTRVSMVIGNMSMLRHTSWQEKARTIIQYL